MESNLLFGAECHGVIVLCWLCPDRICVSLTTETGVLVNNQNQRVRVRLVFLSERDGEKMEVHVLERINAMTTSEEVILPGKAEE